MLQGATSRQACRNDMDVGTDMDIGGDSSLNAADFLD